MKENPLFVVPKENNDEYIAVMLMYQMYQKRIEFHLRVKQTTEFSKMKKVFSESVGIPVRSVRFLYNGCNVDDKDTPQGLRMEQNDVISSSNAMCGDCFLNHLTLEVQNLEV